MDKNEDLTGISFGWVITIIIALCLMGGCLFHLLDKKHKEELNTYLTNLTTCDSSNRDHQKANKLLSNELETLKQGIANKAPDEQLTKDIGNYIHTNFPIVPEVVYNEISIQIATLSRQESVSPELIVGIMEVESAFNPMAISSKNARGLMQVMPAWAKHFNLEKVCNLHNINIGIHTGIKVFKIHVQEENGNISEGLYKYVNRDRSYVDKVYTAMGKFVMFRSRTTEGKTTITEG